MKAPKTLLILVILFAITTKTWANANNKLDAALPHSILGLLSTSSSRATTSNIQLVERSLRRQRRNRTNTRKKTKHTKTTTPVAASDDAGGETAVVTQFQDIASSSVIVGQSADIEFSTTVKDPRGVKKVWFEIYSNGAYTGRFIAAHRGQDQYVTQLQGMATGTTYSWKVRARVGRRNFSESSQQFLLVPSQEASSSGTSVKPETIEPINRSTNQPSATEELTNEPTPMPTEMPTDHQPTSPNKPILPPGNAFIPEVKMQYGLQQDCLTIDSQSFNICLDLKSVSGDYESWMDSFGAAKNRWERVIVQDDGTRFTDVRPMERYMEVATAVPSQLDDLYIAGLEEAIDGVGGIIGMAAPTLLKRVYVGTTQGEEPRYQTLTGVMRFDQADIQNMQRLGSWSGVIAHEMGHVLGLGNLFSMNGLHSGDLRDDEYTGEYAKEEWRNMGCSGTLPIEKDYGLGTAGGHWDEACLDGELMTGFVDSDMPLSRLTVGALKDMGYGVDMSAADPFPLEKLNRCAEYCPEANIQERRNLRRNKQTQAAKRAKKKTKRVSEKTHQQLLQQVESLLEEKRANAPPDLPDDVIYVGGDMLTVYVMEDGELKEDEITWGMIEAARRQ